MNEENLLCRLCAKMYSNKMLFETSSEEFKNLNLAEKIYQYFIININENDVLPKHVCTYCYKKVIETCEFHQQIQKAQELLKIKIEVKEESFGIKFEESDEADSFHFLCTTTNGYSDSDNEPLSKRLTKITKQKGRKTKKPQSNKILNNTSKVIRRKKVKTERRESKLEKSAREPFYVCHMCGKCYKSHAELNSHLKCHNGEKPFKCDKCPKLYKYFKGLQEHKLCHTDLRPHTCQVCGLTFRLKRTLDRHSLVHSETLDHACTFCPKRFKKKYYLKIHLRQHTGERPYSCTECNHFFANDSNFIKHLKGKHGLQQVSIANRHQYPFDFE